MKDAAHAVDSTWQRAELVVTGSDIGSRGYRYFTASFTLRSSRVTVLTTPRVDESRYVAVLR